MTGWSTARWRDFLAAVSIVAASTATAQISMEPRIELEGFSQYSDQTAQVSAKQLETRANDDVTTFLSDVRWTQGDMTLTCGTLVVTYEPNDAMGAVTAARHVRQLEANGDVVLKQNGQTVTGERAILDFHTGHGTVFQKSDKPTNQP
jgi:lipopolysaccharide export system protein LptA